MDNSQDGSQNMEIAQILMEQNKKYAQSHFDPFALTGHTNLLIQNEKHLSPEIVVDKSANSMINSQESLGSDDLVSNLTQGKIRQIKNKSSKEADTEKSIGSPDDSNLPMLS